jgi:hypothetical protein
MTFGMGRQFDIGVAVLAGQDSRFVMLVVAVLAVRVVVVVLVPGLKRRCE